jgi:hypothetical protein
LAVLIHSSIHVAPFAGDLDVGFVNEPAAAYCVAAWSFRVDQQWSEALRPAVDRYVINVDAAFGKEFFDVAV